MRISRHSLATAAVALLLTATAIPALAQTVSPNCDNSSFLADQQQFENGGDKADQPVHICGKVVAVSHRAKKTRSGWHGYFYMSVGGGVSIRIVSDLDRMNAPQWPWVNKGDNVEVVGRYYYDSPRSQGVDWTHHGTGSSWGLPGYVIVNGAKYE
ncbi:hypothetical protein AA23498_3000 [Acetobacter nitrogenifigens DSM 23921 = NBRC 105050]|uniref:DUF3465 domain-containing protein n=1 Tax=Acetobacter nitrogenifigens DSM 23921 = NBRC 105050 TaxID=1120919 RepID=A0A511XA16_9PROT|nr:DUF3465 domain-containing protein [Acetobacter nitrogenifigens]GBQ97798.1 hypothetical protein AA23498_3000 [Acetobacter nitrogenifigens DSM 23921 = NBRC 105050]GEN59794.1 hypothetical protein ANI02nite_16780 [Acetobacter nitrogenifigens DSM 23921 = NBRC 105050]